MRDNQHSSERLGDPAAAGVGVDPIGDPAELDASEEKAGAEPDAEKGHLLEAVGKLANVFAFGKFSDASAAAGVADSAAVADGMLPSDPDDDGTGR